MSDTNPGDTSTSIGAGRIEVTSDVALLVGTEVFIPGRYLAGTVHCRSGSEVDTGGDEEGRLEELHRVEALKDVTRLVTAVEGKRVG